MLLLLSLFLLVPPCLAVMSSGCQSDRNSDDRPRVSCVNQSLTAVPDGIDAGTEVLVLSQNEFTSLSWAAYSAYAQLHELDLSQNHIRVIDPSGPVLEKLSVLRLSSNSLEGLGGRVFRFAPALMEVYLDGNFLRTLHDATFGDLPQLEVIELSRNQLPALPRRLLESVTSTGLKTFDLEDNCVQHLPDEFFSSKPELPYVFLSKNRWVCSCQVGYLEKYLNDQAHNVYIHGNRTMDLKGSVENVPESVVCFEPPFMKGMVIMNLEEDQYCSTNVPTPPLQSYEMAPTFSQTTLAPEPTTSKMIPTTTEPGITTQSPMVTPTTSSKINQPTTTTDTISIPQTASTSTTPASSHSLPASTMSSIWTRFEFWTVQHFWTEVWSQWISESRSFNNTKRTELYSTASTSHDKNSTALPTSTLDPGNLLVHLPWTSPEPATPEPQSTSSTDHPRTSRSPHTSVPGLETLTSFDHASGESRSESSCMVPWCWWLFAGFLPLCILSALCSCMLFLWILITYLSLYRPIQRKLWKQGGGVTLLTFRNTLDSVGGGGLGSETVKFLAPENIPIESQAVFRSVLFIEKGDEEVEENGRREGARDKDRGDTAARIELVPAVEEERTEVTIRREKEGGREVTDRKEMFRKTLYRVISREEEIEGWREVEESWGMPERRMTERRKTRYSLVLREENGSVEDMGGGQEWLVGEWEMGGGRQMKEGSWGSLIRRIQGGASFAPPTPVAGSQTNTPEGGGATADGEASTSRGGGTAQ
ncbi:platelet glycoprotein Ib alpha chain [Pygocentrus nattereri]|uniref:LRRCT domain-containing protein n=1 Tax=Pygocentrus nattereri TaxID=42514 RepID=A0A3B4BWV6_PYGNA|nr:platelet glycoprotein Ib alpha chain [Pygocentrus nattereri]